MLTTPFWNEVDRLAAMDDGRDSRTTEDCVNGVTKCLGISKDKSVWLFAETEKPNVSVLQIYLSRKLQVLAYKRIYVVELVVVYVWVSASQKVKAGYEVVRPKLCKRKGI